MSVPEFDICGPLPLGTTVLEASAGTGKTFTIAALATRYVAEGIAELEQLMIVTFGRAATQELRERVRERLVTAERGLADPARARVSDDELLRLLADVPDEQVALRRQRLAAALAGFDGATIATTHGFCQQMLAGLGITGDLEPGAVFVESIDDLVTDVVDDVYLGKFGRPDAGPPQLTYRQALEVAREAVGDSQAELAPADAGPDSPAGQRYRLAQAVRSHVLRRKREQRLLDYDDMLTRLRDALTDPGRGPTARQRLRSRYDVVLVDEFQDTDPVQWEILRLAFHGHTTLVLIGDPKQAIYGFRGADVVTYLAATEEAGTRATLARNWRSDAALLDALTTFFGRAALGDPRIVVRPGASAHPERRMRDAPAQAPLRVRLLRRDQAVKRTGGGLVQVGAARQQVADDCAGDIVRLLSSPGRLTVAGRDEPVCPGDIAVLVRTNRQGTITRDALEAVGVPAVLTATASVFATETAKEWLVLLQAIEQPHRAGRVRSAALTCFVGWSAAALADAGEQTLDELGPRLRGWADVLGERGVAALLEVMTTTGRLTERLLATTSGERRLTDLRHIAQALHEASVELQLGPAALVEWLGRRIAEAAADTAAERSRRLESDADAVQVVTVHRSKGLEFPVVYVPFGWDRNRDVGGSGPLRLHDATGRRLLDVGGLAGPGHAERRAAHEAEESGEDLRLLYVALTRAQCQVVAWWVPTWNTESSSVHRFLFGGAGPGNAPAPVVRLPTDDEAQTLLLAMASKAGAGISIEAAAGAGLARWLQAPGPAAQLAAAVFDRSLDTAWRRTSYSGLTAAVHEAPAAAGAGSRGGGAGPALAVDSEPEVPQLADEAEPGAPPAARSAGEAESAGEDATGSEPDSEMLRASISPMATLPAGTSFGTLVHTVLETVDTSAPDLQAELTARCEAALAGRSSSGLDPQALASGLLPVFRTPLGPLAPGYTLAVVPPADRLTELGFELPLGGGDDVSDASTTATLGAVAQLLRRHLPADDVFAGYAVLLDGPLLRGEQLRGYLTGSLDAVLRLRDAAGEPRYVVVDYKTNWLGADLADPNRAGTDQLTAWHYRPAALTGAMLAAHYPLQALLYSVALHRYLRWRQPGYDAELHLGGALYLFVRGMCGPDTPLVGGVPCGVLGWRPPTALVEDLSRLLDSGGPHRGSFVDGAA